MFRYRFVHDFETVFGHLVHGEHTRVIPGDKRDLPGDGSTVVLRPGDVLETSEVQVHAHLEPANAATEKATAAAREQLAADQAADTPAPVVEAEPETVPSADPTLVQE